MKKEVFFAALSLALAVGITAPSVNAENKSEPPSILVTPPAPKFTDAERQSELAQRRQAVAAKMTADSVLVMWSAEPRNYAGDVDFMYRQENNLYYLTNLRQKGASLVMVKNGATVQEFLFLPRRDPANETWNGKMYSREDAARISGVKTIVDSSELTAFITALGKKESFTSKENVNIAPVAANIYLQMPNGERDGDGMAEFKRELDFSKLLTSSKVVNARPILDELRLVKSPMEIKLLQHAIDITTEAQMRALATAKSVKWEYETQAEIEYIFRKRNADYWGYPSIVGCGPNATTLHYEESQGGVKSGDLLLMDVGAEYGHYTADVTRTFPISGKFTAPQREIYQIVYDAQEAAARTIKPGATFGDPSRAANLAIQTGLVKAGLITAIDATYEIDYNGQKIKMPQYRLWYMHGWGHWLGMNVHDVGDYQAVFKPGMVMTNEPGIYIREDALNYLPDTPANREFLAKIKPAYEKYKNIGVRIEDDMLVTATGTEWMSKKLPRTIADVEAFMAKNSITVAVQPLKKNIELANALTGYKINSFLPEKRAIAE